MIPGKGLKSSLRNAGRHMLVFLQVILNEIQVLGSARSSPHTQSRSAAVRRDEGDSCHDLGG